MSGAHARSEAEVSAQLGRTIAWSPLRKRSALLGEAAVGLPQMEIGKRIESPTLGLVLTWREVGTEVLAFDMTMRAGAPAIPMHVHPRQEERISVISGTVRSCSGGRERFLTAGEHVLTPPGEPHTIEPAAGGDAEVQGELRPALAYAQFIERSFALDRSGHINARGRANPLRMAATGIADAEFFLSGPPVAVQKPLLRLLAWLGQRLGYEPT